MFFLLFFLVFLVAFVCNCSFALICLSFCIDDTRGVHRCSGHAPWHVDSGLISSPHYSVCTVHMFNDGVFHVSE